VLDSKVQILNTLLVALDIKNEGEYCKNLGEGMKLNESYQASASKE
jgi:hypothetical protein